jgi:hypothetical protein
MAIPLIASDVLTTLDAYAVELAAAYPGLGLGLLGESGTAAAAAINGKAKILGGVGNDGVTVYPGIRNNDVKAQLALPLDAAIQQLRYDAVFQRVGRAPAAVLDTQVVTSLPTGWILSSPAGLHYLNNWLLRANAAHTGVPAAPAAAGVLTATSTAAGAMPLTSAPNAPRVLHTLVGANEWDESLPSAEATQVALTGTSNGFTYQIAGLVPAGTNYVKVYRSLFAAAGAPYGYDQRVPVTPGAAFPPILLVQSDPSLLMNWNPPSWLSCLIRPEAAVLIALAYSLGGLTGIRSGVPLMLLANNMVTPANVLLGPSNGFLGLGNQVQGAQFGSRTIGSAYVPGAISNTNNAATGVQGFAGAIGLQARVTAPLDAAGTISATYSYYDAAHGYGVAQSATTTAVAFSGTAVGSLAVMAIPDGRLVISVSADTPSGQTSGGYVWEAAPIRP